MDSHIPILMQDISKVYETLGRYAKHLSLHHMHLLPYFNIKPHQFTSQVTYYQVQCSLIIQNLDSRSFLINFDKLDLQY